MTTTALDLLFTTGSDNWLEAIPAYQANPLRQLIEQRRTFDEVADAWLSATAENTYQFGGDRTPGNSSQFREKLLLELEGFLCGDSKYEKERLGLFGEKSVTRTFVVSSLSVAIAPQLGVTAAFLAPVIALTVAAVVKMPVNAWCAMRKENRAGQGAPPT